MMNRFVAVAVVVLAAPFVVGLARAALTAELEPVVKTARELMALAEPGALARKEGVAVVEMPEVPNADGREPMADGRSPMADRRLPIADGRWPMADGRQVGLACPDVRALVTGDSPFAIVAWGDSSVMVKTSETVATPAGPVTVRRITSHSIAFAQADTTLQCKLPVR